MSTTPNSGALWTEATDKNVQTKLRQWNQEVEQRGKDAIHIKLPAKILEMNELLDNFSESTILPLATSEPPPLTSPPNEEADTSNSSIGRKKRKVVNGKEAQASGDTIGLGDVKNPGHVSSNAKVNAHYIFLRIHWEGLINITNDIKLYINLLVPKIEDGDTFGVQVQEECLSELSRAQDSGYNLLEAQLKQNTTRGKLASKVIKYPNLEDYQIALHEHDRKSIYLCRQHLLDLRNIYTLLTDLLHKNIAKITKPKGANSDGMY